jgi:uncharacterized protein YndB with AHSA1/START domain
LENPLPDFTITRQINAPVEKVWEVLEKFGDIADWNSGVKRSSLTSQGPVSEGSTRHCDLAPFGGVEERIGSYLPNERMTVNIEEASKLPMSSAVADFNIAAQAVGTELTLHYSYTSNRLGRMAKGTTDKQMRKGITGLADDLVRESERITVAS